MSKLYKDKNGECTAKYETAYKCKGFTCGSYGMICGNIYSPDNKRCMFKGDSDCESDD